MKWTYNGQEFEGSVDEYMDFQQKVSVDKSIKDVEKSLKNVEPKKSSVFFGNTKKHWTKPEMRLLKDSVVDHDIDGLMKLFPDRTRQAIFNKMFTMKLHLGKSVSSPKSKKHWTASENRIIKDNVHKLSFDELLTYLPGRSAGALQTHLSLMGMSRRAVIKQRSSHKFTRMSFIGKRLNYYMRRFNWDRTKATIQANWDFDNGHLTMGTISPQAFTEKIFKLCKYTIGSDKVVTIDVFGSKEDAEKCKAECEIGDRTIGEVGNTYMILKNDILQRTKVRGFQR